MKTVGSGFATTSLQTSPREIPFLWIVVAALLCGLLAYGSIVLTRGTGRMAAIWIPNALLVAILGRRSSDPISVWVFPAFLTNVMANLLVGDDMRQATGLAFANLVEVSLCVGLLRRIGIVRPDMSIRRDLARFCLIGGAVAPGFSALLIITVLQPASWTEAAWTFATWSLTHGSCMILLAPTLWIFRGAWVSRSRPSAATVQEWAMILILGTALTVLVFSQNRFTLLFLVMPVVFVHAFRLGLLGTAFSIIKISIIAWVATAAGRGPIHLIHDSLAMQLINLQLFLTTSFAIGLPVAVMLEERKRALEDLVEARDLHQSMLENMQETIFRTDIEGRWEFLNPAWQKLTGYSVEQSLGSHAASLLPPEEATEFHDIHRTLEEGKVDAIITIQRFRTARGDLRTCEVSTRVLTDTQGRFIGTVGNIRDITVQQRAEQALVQSKREFETLAAIAPVGIVRCSSDGSVTYSNPAWLKLTGLAEKDALGTSWTSALHVDDYDRVVADWNAAVDRSGAYRTEFRFDTGAKVTWVDVIAEPERAGDGNVSGFVAVLVDITERKALEDALISARRHAESAAVAKSAFLANMSHEIRTPMNGVLGFAELLLDSQVEEEPRRFAKLIVDSGGEMMRLLNDILDLSKIEAGQMRILREPVDLAHLLKRCIRMMSANAKGKGLDLTLDVAADLPAIIVGDGQRIRQVALNLIGNAVKFTDQGHVTVRGRSVCDANGAAQLQIEVEDSGIGISAQQQESIFQPFAQGDGSIARRYGGTGLGLTICRQLAEAMGGTLSLKSKPGRGSTFCFALPLKEPRRLCDRLAAARDETQVAVTPEPGRPLHILLAEDLDINQRLLIAILSRAGHRITIANDGAEAIQHVDQAAAAAWMYDVVLMDLQMPNVDGLTAARTIRSRGHGPDELPIIALTANAFGDDIAACLKAGMQAHLAKPISRPALTEALSRWCDDEKAVGPVPNSGDDDGDGGFVIDQNLRDLYFVRRTAVLAQVERMTSEECYDDQSAKSLAAELHKLAGTAGLFGEAEIGTLAAMLERQLLAWNAEERQLRVADIATRFQKVASNQRRTGQRRRARRPSG